jgi:anti-sigma factor (TIGR02949 family)
MSPKKDIPEIAESDCLAAMDHLYAFLNGELDHRTENYALVKHHLGHCRSCFSRAEMERQLNERLKNSAGEKASGELRERLRKLMDGFQ